MILRSPNEMLAAAQEQMLDGREPETKEDWAIVANFFAYNIHIDAVEPAMKLIRMIYDMPLSEQEIIAICQFQVEKRRKEEKEK